MNLALFDFFDLVAGEILFLAAMVLVATVIFTLGALFLSLAIQFAISELRKVFNRRL